LELHQLDPGDATLMQDRMYALTLEGLDDAMRTRTRKS
jgi:uncharacterized protein with von Willebrand factor type A (vWA) domain